MDINRLAIWGVIRDNNIIMKRTSGAIDVIPYVSEDPIEEGRYKISGQLRSRRDGHHLQPYVFIEQAIPAEDILEANEVIIEGHVCSEPFYKELRSRRLKAFMLAVDGNRCYYIPVVCWGRIALSEIAVGDKLILTGRIQSREYTKGNEVRTAYELSVKTLQKVPK